MNSSEQEVVHKRKLKTKIILIVLAILAVLAIAFYIFVWPLIAAKVMAWIDNLILQIGTYALIGACLAVILFIGYFATCHN